VDELRTGRQEIRDGWGTTWSVAGDARWVIGIDPR